MSGVDPEACAHVDKTAAGVCTACYTVTGGPCGCDESKWLRSRLEEMQFHADAIEEELDEARTEIEALKARKETK